MGASLFASSHLLLSFSMIPYNSTQALLPLTLGLGLSALAWRRSSVFRYLLVGIAVGMGLFAYASVAQGDSPGERGCRTGHQR